MVDLDVHSRILWMNRLRVERRLLVKYRASNKIDKHLYHELYHLAKGNTFKHKRALVEHVRFLPHDIMTSSSDTSDYRHSNSRTHVLTFFSTTEPQGQGREAA